MVAVAKAVVFATSVLAAVIVVAITIFPGVSRGSTKTHVVSTSTLAPNSLIAFVGKIPDAVAPPPIVSESIPRALAVADRTEALNITWYLPGLVIAIVLADINEIPVPRVVAPALLKVTVVGVFAGIATEVFTVVLTIAISGFLTFPRRLTTPVPVGFNSIVPFTWLVAKRSVEL